MNKLLGLPILASKQGADVDLLIVFLHILMAALFVGWAAYFVYALWRFRQARNPKADYVGVTSHASSWVEVAVAFFEGVLLLGFAVPLWAKAVDVFPKESESTVIRVTARQFNWMVRYAGPNGVFGKQDFRLVTAQRHGSTRIVEEGLAGWGGRATSRADEAEQGEDTRSRAGQCLCRMMW